MSDQRLIEPPNKYDINRPNPYCFAYHREAILNPLAVVDPPKHCVTLEVT